ncbi:MAG: hypothetical protein WDW38_006444 [Sanguina aurantia]
MSATNSASLWPRPLSLSAHSDGTLAKVDFKLQQPAIAQLQLDLAQGGDYKWTARLDAPSLDPKPWLGDSALKSLAVSLQGQGDRYSGDLNGLLTLNDYRVKLQPLRVQFSHDFTLLTLQELNIGSTQFSGSVAASGTVQLSAQPVSADLLIQWKDLQLPAELVGQPLASRGTLKASGSADKYHAEGDVAIGPPGKLASLALNLDGTPAHISLHTLALKQARGNLTVNGTLTLQPALAWQIEAAADQLDPGQLLAGWNGALNFDIASQGTLPQNRPDVTFDIRKLTGVLRRLSGVFHVRGRHPKLSIDGQLQGQAIVYQQQHVASMQLDAAVPDISNPGGKFTLGLQGVSAAGLQFSQVSLRAGGTAAQHNVNLDAHGGQVSVTLALNGALKGSDWRGTLAALTCASARQVASSGRAGVAPAASQLAYIGGQSAPGLLLIASRCRSQLIDRAAGRRAIDADAGAASARRPAAAADGRQCADSRASIARSALSPCSARRPRIRDGRRATDRLGVGATFAWPSHVGSTARSRARLAPSRIRQRGAGQHRSEHARAGRKSRKRSKFARSPPPKTLFDEALKLQFARCSADPACKKRFGDPDQTLYQLRDALRANPHTVSFRDPETYKAVKRVLNENALASVVRLFAYAAHRCAPADAKILSGDLADLMGSGMRRRPDRCDDADRHQPRRRMHDPRPAHMIDALEAVCSVWPKGTRPADFHQPLKTDKPILLLAGQYDRSSPPRRAKR